MLSLKCHLGIFLPLFCTQTNQVWQPLFNQDFWLRKGGSIFQREREGEIKEILTCNLDMISLLVTLTRFRSSTAKAG